MQPYLTASYLVNNLDKQFQTPQNIYMIPQLQQGISMCKYRPLLNEAHVTFSTIKYLFLEKDIGWSTSCTAVC